MIDLRNDTVVANVWGFIFIAVAVLGFIPNPLISPDGLFAVNTAHNAVHALLGLILLIGAAQREGKKALLLVGIIYLVVAALGYLLMSDMLFGIVRLNMPDHWLHLLLGIVLIWFGVRVRPATV